MPIDQITRKQRNLVLKDGTDRLMVDVEGVTLTPGSITLDMTDTNAKLDSLEATTVLVKTAVQALAAALPLTDAELRDSPLVVRPYSAGTLEWTVTSGSTAMTNTTAVILMMAGTDINRNYINSIQLYNTSTLVETLVTILDGSTVIWVGHLAAATTAIRKIEVTFPMPLRGSLGASISLQLSTTGASVYYNVQGYQGA